MYVCYKRDFFSLLMFSQTLYSSQDNSFNISCPVSSDAEDYQPAFQPSWIYQYLF